MKLKNFNLSKFNDFEDVYINIKNKYILIKKFDFNIYNKNNFEVKQIGEIKNNKNYKNYRIIIINE